jgi:hypothetical protein
MALEGQTVQLQQGSVGEAFCREIGLVFCYVLQKFQSFRSLPQRMTCTRQMKKRRGSMSLSSPFALLAPHMMILNLALISS